MGQTSSNIPAASQLVPRSRASFCQISHGIWIEETIQTITQPIIAKSYTILAKDLALAAPRSFAQLFAIPRIQRRRCSGWHAGCQHLQQQLEVPCWTKPILLWSGRHAKNVGCRSGICWSIDWFKGKITGKSYSSWENRWFPADFPLSQPIELSQCTVWRCMRSLRSSPEILVLESSCSNVEKTPNNQRFGFMIWTHFWLFGFMIWTWLLGAILIDVHWGQIWIHDLYFYPPWSCQAAPILRHCEECHADDHSATQRMAAMLLAVARQLKVCMTVWVGVLGLTYILNLLIPNESNYQMTQWVFIISLKRLKLHWNHGLRWNYLEVS